MCNIGVDLKERQPKNFPITFANSKKLKYPWLNALRLEQSIVRIAQEAEIYAYLIMLVFSFFFSGMEYHKQGRLKKLGFGRERMGNGKTFTSIAQSQHPLTNRHTKLLEIFSNCMIECVFGLQCPSFLFSPWQKITKMLDCTKL